MLVTMSDKELSRINVIQSVVEKRMRRRDAAHQLALTERQTQRLMNRFRESGPAGLANLRRGRPGNHRLPESLKLRVLSLLHDHYSDFGPTLAAEKLRERHNITVSVETLRKWMTADGLWVPYSRRRPRVHQPRYRRDGLGELVQIDGSPHDWFEGRAPKCCLMAAYSLNSMRAGLPTQNGSSAFRDNKNFYRLYLSRDNIIGGGSG